MPTRGLELPVQAVELVVHAVDVRGECAELVAVADVDVTREIARGDRSQPGVDSLDRPDDRPGEDEPEQQREDDRGRGHADVEVALARVRARVLRDHSLGCNRRRDREVRGSLVEVGGEPMCLVAQWLLLFVGGTTDRGFDDPYDHDREALALRANLAKDESILCGWHEPETIDAGRRAEPH